MDLAGETTPLLGAGHVVDEEAAGVSTSPTRKKSFPRTSQIAALMLITTVWPFSFEMIYPFINQFIMEIGVTDDPENVGFYSGLVESIFAVVQLFTIMPASAISDRWGRKPVLLFGTTGVAVAMALFGMSTRYWMMLVTRCIGGGIGGASTAVRVMAREMSDNDNQSSIWTLISITYRIGQVVGQPIGGFLAHPERHWPKTFAGEFWAKYPFSLPCFVGAGFALCAVAYAAVVLKETLSTRGHRQHPSRSLEGAVNESEPLIRSGSKSRGSALRLVLIWPLLSMLLNHSTMVLLAETLFAVYPIFAFMPVERGGLALSEARIGVHMSFRAVTQILALVPYPYLERRYGFMRMYRFSMLLWPVTIAFFPLLNLIARSNGEDGFVWYGALFVFFMVWAFTGWTWTGMFIMVNNATPDAAALSSMNSLSTIFVSVPLSIAPAIATSSFSLSIQSKILGGNLIWVAMFAVGVAGFVHSTTLTTRNHDWREETPKDISDRE